MKAESIILKMTAVNYRESHVHMTLGATNINNKTLFSLSYGIQKMKYKVASLTETHRPDHGQQPILGSKKANSGVS